MCFCESILKTTYSLVWPAARRWVFRTDCSWSCPPGWYVSCSTNRKRTWRSPRMGPPSSLQLRWSEQLLRANKRSSWRLITKSDTLLRIVVWRPCTAAPTAGFSIHCMFCTTAYYSGVSLLGQGHSFPYPFIPFSSFIHSFIHLFVFV